MKLLSISSAWCSSLRSCSGGRRSLKSSSSCTHKLCPYPDKQSLLLKCRQLNRSCSAITSLRSRSYPWMNLFPSWKIQKLVKHMCFPKLRNFCSVFKTNNVFQPRSQIAFAQDKQFLIYLLSSLAFALTPLLLHASNCSQSSVACLFLIQKELVYLNFSGKFLRSQNLKTKSNLSFFTGSLVFDFPYLWILYSKIESQWMFYSCQFQRFVKQNESWSWQKDL